MDRRSWYPLYRRTLNIPCVARLLLLFTARAQGTDPSGFLQIDMRAWYRFCRNVTWNSLYYDDIAHHLDDMRDDLRRIQSRRQAFQRQLSLAKSEFVPVGRRSGMAF